MLAVERLAAFERLTQCACVLNLRTSYAIGLIYSRLNNLCTLSARSFPPQRALCLSDPLTNQNIIFATATHPQPHCKLWFQRLNTRSVAPGGDVVPMETGAMGYIAELLQHDVYTLVLALPRQL